MTDEEYRKKIDETVFTFGFDPDDEGFIPEDNTVDDVEYLRNVTPTCEKTKACLPKSFWQYPKTEEEE